MFSRISNGTLSSNSDELYSKNVGKNAFESVIQNILVSEIARENVDVWIVL
jgi:hypothetical protein